MPSTELSVDFCYGLPCPVGESWEDWEVFVLREGGSRRDENNHLIGYDTYGCSDTKLPIGLRRKLAVGTAFVIETRYDDYQIISHPNYDNIEHWMGLIMWNHPISHCPKTPELRRRDAEGTLALYNDWRNGRCYEFELNGDIEDSCMGFYGEESNGMEDTIKESIYGFLQHHPEVKRTILIHHRFTILDIQDDPEELRVYITGEAAFLVEDMEISNDN